MRAGWRSGGLGYSIACEDLWRVGGRGAVVKHVVCEVRGKRMVRTGSGVTLLRNAGARIGTCEAGSGCAG